jgi:membrane protease YdiL (CAAX protease family)
VPSTVEPRSTPIATLLFVVGAVALPALRLLVWGTLATGALKLPALWGTAATLALLALFLSYYRLCGWRRSVREVARVRLRPIRRGWRWMGAALPALVLVDLAWMTLLLHFRGPPAPAAADPSEQAFGWLLALSTACIAGPVIEEVVFRGWVLRRLEQRFALMPAALLTALLFALAHLSLGGLPSRFIWGCLLAVSVHATGSLRAAIVLHAVGNAVPITLDLVLSDAQLLAVADLTWVAAIAGAVLIGAVVALVRLSIPIVRQRRGTA